MAIKQFNHCIFVFVLFKTEKKNLFFLSFSDNKIMQAIRSRIIHLLVLSGDTEIEFCNYSVLRAVENGYRQCSYKV